MYLLKHIFIFFSIIAIFNARGQDVPEKQRVLFVLDASGSMEALWGTKTRMEVAKTTLYNLVDSLEKATPNIEVGLRVFGHQFHKSLNNCTDSKLEVPFGPNNAEKLKATLDRIKPNGNTPIAYSLIQSANDFDDSKTMNSIILITDGLENCEGNPCDAAKHLNDKRITINPFIIGLDIQDDLINSFKCIGTFINAKDEKTLKMVLQNTVKQATGKTTLSIGIYSLGNQEITNTPISIIDPINNTTLYTYIHSLTKKGLPDTLYIDPRGFYQIQVHSYPPLLSESFQLTPSVHNNVNLQMNKSYLDFNHEKLYDDPQARFIVRLNDSWVYNYDIQDLPLLADVYQVSSTLLPLKNELLSLDADKVYNQSYPTNGKLSIENNQKIRASIFTKSSDKWAYVVDLGLLVEDYTLKLQPGTYSLVYIMETERNSDNTHRYDFEISEGRTSVVKLR
jgi:Ca-activated chloride channel family protein